MRPDRLAKEAFADLVGAFFACCCEDLVAMRPPDPSAKPTTFCGWLAGERIAVKASYWPHRTLCPGTLRGMAERLEQATGARLRVIMCSYEVDDATRAEMPEGVVIVDRYAVAELVGVRAPHLREAAWAAIAALPPAPPGQSREGGRARERLGGSRDRRSEDRKIEGTSP